MAPWQVSSFMNDRFQPNRPFRPLVNASRGDGVEEVEITRRDLGQKGEGAVGQRSLVVVAEVDCVVRGLDRRREGPIQMVATVELGPFIPWARNRQPHPDQNN